MHLLTDILTVDQHTLAQMVFNTSLGSGQSNQLVLTDSAAGTGVRLWSKSLSMEFWSSKCLNASLANQGGIE